MYHPIKEKNMRDLAEFNKKLRKDPKLSFLFFELTDRCNLGCRHCGSNCTYRNDKFLPFAEIRKIMISVSQRYDPKQIMVCLSGGEPVLHPDLMEIIRTAHVLGFYVGMTTNGTLIDDSKAKELQRSGLDTIAVSIDGTRETHDCFRGVKGCFDQAIEGIKSLKKAGIEPEIVTAVHKGNIGELQ